MKNIIAALAFIALSLFPGVASAVPDVIYNPSNGNIQFVNDTPNSLFAMYILSPTNRITGAALQIPGATLDTADQPFALAYLFVPPGTHNVGNVIQPGTPFSELSGFFYYTPFSGPFRAGTPEPSSCLMAAMSVLAVAGGARRAGRPRARKGIRTVLVPPSCRFQQ
jgi:hypothetical protein